MSSNISRWERALRYVFGTIALGWAIAGGPTWSYASIYLIVTAVVGVCPVYMILRMGSSRG